MQQLAARDIRPIRSTTMPLLVTWEPYARKELSLTAMAVPIMKRPKEVNIPIKFSANARFVSVDF